MASIGENKRGNGLVAAKKQQGTKRSASSIKQQPVLVAITPSTTDDGGDDDSKDVAEPQPKSRAVTAALRQSNLEVPPPSTEQKSRAVMTALRQSDLDVPPPSTDIYGDINKEAANEEIDRLTQSLAGAEDVIVQRSLELQLAEANTARQRLEDRIKRLIKQIGNLEGDIKTMGAKQSRTDAEMQQTYELLKFANEEKQKNALRIDELIGELDLANGKLSDRDRVISTKSGDYLAEVESLNRMIEQLQSEGRKLQQSSNAKQTAKDNTINDLTQRIIQLERLLDNEKDTTKRLNGDLKQQSDNSTRQLQDNEGRFAAQAVAHKRQLDIERGKNAELSGQLRQLTQEKDTSARELKQMNDQWKQVGETLYKVGTQLQELWDQSGGTGRVFVENTSDSPDVILRRWVDLIVKMNEQRRLDNQAMVDLSNTLIGMALTLNITDHLGISSYNIATSINDWKPTMRALQAAIEAAKKKADTPPVPISPIITTPAPSPAGNDEYLRQIQSLNEQIKALYDKLQASEVKVLNLSAEKARVENKFNMELAESKRVSNLAKASDDNKMKTLAAEVERLSAARTKAQTALATAESKLENTITETDFVTSTLKEQVDDLKVERDTLLTQLDAARTRFNSQATVLTTQTAAAKGAADQKIASVQSTADQKISQLQTMLAVQQTTVDGLQRQYSAYRQDVTDCMKWWHDLMTILLERGTDVPFYNDSNLRDMIKYDAAVILRLLNRCKNQAVRLSVYTKTARELVVQSPLTLSPPMPLVDPTPRSPPNIPIQTEMKVRYMCSDHMLGWCIVRALRPYPTQRTAITRSMVDKQWSLATCLLYNPDTRSICESLASVYDSLMIAMRSPSPPPSKYQIICDDASRQFVNELLGAFNWSDTGPLVKMVDVSPTPTWWKYISDPSDRSLRSFSGLYYRASVYWVDNLAVIWSSRRGSTTEQLKITDLIDQKRANGENDEWLMG